MKDISKFLSQDSISEKFSEIIGKNAQTFISSVLSAINQNEQLKSATPESVYSCSVMAATLNLPVNPNLGFAYFVPFNNRKKGLTECQFQIGYKGYIQLAQRSGSFKSIGACPVYEGQIVDENPLFGNIYDWTKKESDKVVGYVAQFTLLNGFEKQLYMTIEEVNKHGKKYSQTYSRGFGLWKDNFDAMATKTIIKRILSKFAPLSIEMQRAVIADSSVINDAETLDVNYVDNEPMTIEERNNEAEKKNVEAHIKQSKTLEDLEEVKDFVKAFDLVQVYEEKKKSWEV